jgi:biopolymer transport protein ExbD
MFNNKKDINKPFRDTSNRALGLGLVVYILLLIATAILFQGCEIKSVNPQLEELQKQQKEEIEKKINDTSGTDNNGDGQNETIQDPSNPLFTLMDTSLIKSNIDCEQNFEDFTTIVYALEAEGYMNISFIKILGKKGIRIESVEGSKSYFIEFNQMEANVVGGEYDKYVISINGNHLYLFNDEGAYIFIS